MNIIQTLNSYFHMVEVIVLVLFIAGVSFFLLSRRKKQHQSREYETDYSHLKRKDIIDYVKFDGVLSDEQGNGVLALDKNRRFVAGISTVGNDFYHKDSAEQLIIMDGMKSFVNTLRGPLQITQTTRVLNMDTTTSMFVEARKEALADLFTLTEDYKTLRQESENVSDEDYEAYYYKTLVSMQEQINSLQWMQEGMNSTVERIESLSGENAEPLKEISYFFDWNYADSPHMVELDAGQRGMKALAELDNKGSMIRASLAKCSVYGERYSGDEMLDYFWRFYHPYTSKKQTLDQVRMRLYEKMIVTSDSLSDKAVEVQTEYENGTLGQAGAFYDEIYEDDVLEDEEVSETTETTEEGGGE